jgi:hypothetical protein
MIGIDGGSMSNQFIALTTKNGRISAALLVELPGIETDALPDNMTSELPVRSVSI